MPQRFSINIPKFPTQSRTIENHIPTLSQISQYDICHTKYVTFVTVEKSEQCYNMSVAKIKHGGNKMTKAQIHKKSVEYVAAYYKTYPELEPELAEAIYWSHYWQLSREAK